MTIGSTHLVRRIGTWLACLWCCCSPAQAQVPPAIKQAILASGRTVDGRAMAELYGPLQEHEPYRGITVVRDIRYGPFEQQLADVFVEKRQGQRKRPVLIFVHGGGFTAGARKLSRESPFYDNVALWAARHGFVAISIDYRLAPAATWPAAAEDIGTAVRWARANAASYGGNPDRLFLMGHSAGATHVASYGADRTLWHGDTPGVHGMIIISGSFTVEAPETAPAADRPLLTRAKAYFGSDPDKFAANRPLMDCSLRELRCCSPMPNSIPTIFCGSAGNSCPPCRGTGPRISAASCLPGTTTCPRSTRSTRRTNPSPVKSSHSSEGTEP